MPSSRTKRNASLTSSVVLCILLLGWGTSAVFPESPVTHEIQRLISLLVPSASDIPPPDQEGETTVLAADVWQVERVVDGDTLVVKRGEVSEKLRLIGVNTPETVDPRRSVECFGKEASLFVKQLLEEGATVRLETDPSQGERDRYGRLLVYLFREGEADSVNETLILNGFAHEYTYQKPYLYQDRFRAAQLTAQTEQRGLWDPTRCPSSDSP